MICPACGHESVVAAKYCPEWGRRSRPLCRLNARSGRSSRALSFWRSVVATRYIREAEVLLATTA